MRASMLRYEARAACLRSPVSLPGRYSKQLLLAFHVLQEGEDVANLADELRLNAARVTVRNQPAQALCLTDRILIRSDTNLCVNGCEV